MFWSVVIAIVLIQLLQSFIRCYEKQALAKIKQGKIVNN